MYGRYRVNAASGKRIKKINDMMMACDLLIMSVLLPLVTVVPALDDPESEVATGPATPEVAEGAAPVPAAAELMKGFEDVPPTPFVRSRVKVA